MGSIVRTIGITVFLVAGAIASVDAQEVTKGRATVRLVVVDSTSGRPIRGALVRATGWMGVAITNSSGWFLMQDVPVDAEVTIRCPSQRRFAGGPFVARQQLALTLGVKNQVVVRVPGERCEEPPIRSITGEYSGHYTGGFESSEFWPCEGLPADADYYGISFDAAWVEFDKGLHVAEGVKWPKTADSVKADTIYVRWHGTFTGPGGYGHMGLSTYEFVVDSVIELRLRRPDDCHAPVYIPSPRPPSE